jgi:signal transduction histidine kinase
VYDGDARAAGAANLPALWPLLLLRAVLIIATGCLLSAEAGLIWPPLPCLVLLVAALASTAVGATLPPRWLRARYFASAVMGVDALWIAAALLLSRRLGVEFLFAYCSVLLIAAIGESLWLVGIAATAACAAYVALLSLAGDRWAVAGSPSFVRIPFLLAAAAYYAVLIDRVRGKRRRGEQAERIKSEFLGTISHELRTPLTIILGYVDLLLDGEFGTLSSDQRAVLGKVHAASGNLHRYLSRLLDVSRLVNRLQSGREAVTCSEFTLASVFAELRDDFLERDSARVGWPTLHDVPPLYTDREKLVTILRNLVDNALKYGRDAPITITAGWERADDAVTVVVADRGLGISSGDLPHIFDPFRRTVEAANTGASGVGLGLYIVKQLAELLGATLSVESTLGVGSRFTIRMPRRWELRVRPAA